MHGMEPIEIKEFRNRIGRAIRKLREEEGVSAQFLARILGVTQPTVSRIENGNTSIAAEKLCFLAKSFNRQLSYFIGDQSALIHDEEDVLRAGLVSYGAKHLKSKRTIDICEYYRTYADFLNVALTEVDDPRFTAALATTLYKQTAENKLKITRIISTITHERLISNLKALIEIINLSIDMIKRPSKERKNVQKQLLKLDQELGKETRSSKSIVVLVDSRYFAEFLNESIGYE
ncbi:helix-turn-helix domain-containing protein [bacterium]|nr:helix-turn-helix domain-containing protein [bacterium]